VFEESTNLFIPLYRQSSLKHAAAAFMEDGHIDNALIGTPYGDISAALDYYFEHYNQGRPFVIAGHSQGAAILRLLLKRYFKEHPDRYERMVAAYAIGYSITKEDLEANPHMKFATGETDTGVIISWHAEGPKSVGSTFMSAAMLPNGISINPLNWKRDETYAPASMNLGSIVLDEKTGTTEIRDIEGDAQVNLARGTVITNAKAEPNEMVEFAGPQSYHQDDYSIFYNHIKANVAKRIAAYQAKK
jgi:pimeloyl-ACP methyl ester carboxylesterase